MTRTPIRPTADSPIAIARTCGAYPYTEDADHTDACTMVYAHHGPHENGDGRIFTDTLGR